MENYNPTITLPKTIPFSGVKVYLFQVLFLALAVFIPYLAHITNAPVRWLLPMHWFVIIAGLTYGWRGGLIIGILSPAISFLITGFPVANIIPAMIVELVTYGLITGLLCEYSSISPFISVTIALLLGRMFFIITVFCVVTIDTAYSTYFTAALLPGIIAGVVQIVSLPLLARWWMKQEMKNL